MAFKQVTRCRICNSPHLHSYLNLGETPLANGLVSSTTDEVTKYPLKVLFCDFCSLSQLSIVVDPKIMYSEYHYRSSVSQTFKNHCRDMALHLKEMFKVDFPKMVDIASNDGALMREFQKVGYAVMGVEPARNLNWPYCGGEPPVERPLPVIDAFWSHDVTKLYTVGLGRDIITATNVFAHVDDLGDFLAGVREWLTDKGVFVVEVPYLYDLLSKHQFDTIYHEHLSYFLLKPLQILFDYCQLPIFRVERHPIHGGSLRIFASKNAHPVEKSVDDLIEFEIANNLYDFFTYEHFSNEVTQVRDDLVILLENLKAQGKKVMGYGASAKGCNLLNFSRLDSSHIKMIVDDTPDKQGKFIPGCNIPIVDFSHFNKEQPDYILLLAWNFAAELIAKTTLQSDRGCKYIVPIPKVDVI